MACCGSMVRRTRSASHAGACTVQPRAAREATARVLAGAAASAVAGRQGLGWAWCVGGVAAAAVGGALWWGRCNPRGALPQDAAPPPRPHLSTPCTTRVLAHELACEMVRYSALSGSSLAECAAMTYLG